jgi:hypothetical protein
MSSVTVKDIMDAVGRMPDSIVVDFVYDDVVLDIEKLEIHTEASGPVERGELSKILEEVKSASLVLVPPITDAFTDEQINAVEQVKKNATLSDWYACLIKERDELGAKLATLREMFTDPRFGEFTELVREQLVLQESVLSTYYLILNQRIKGIT